METDSNKETQRPSVLPPQSYSSFSLFISYIFPKRNGLTMPVTCMQPWDFLLCCSRERQLNNYEAVTKKSKQHGSQTEAEVP